MSHSYDVLVIGGGPAGMMAAGQAAKMGAGVLLVDKNTRCGRKLALTGKGRCNVTNDCDIQTFLKHLPQNGKFLYSALCQFSPKDTMAFFEGLGVPLKGEENGRVFPASDKAMDIVEAMRQFAFGRAAFQTGRAEALIIATGGLSYPVTGSTGDGYQLARSAGHTIVPPRASLVALSSPDAFCGQCAGLTLKNISVSLWENGKRIYDAFGELLFTHTGVSGPAALSASAHMRRADADYRLFVDLLPDVAPETLDERLITELAAGRLAAVKTVLAPFAPKSLALPVLAQAGVPPRNQGGGSDQGTAARHRGRFERVSNFPPAPGAGRGSDGHRRRRFPSRGKPQNYGIQARFRPVLCRRSVGPGRVHRRVQPADCLYHRLCRRDSRSVSQLTELNAKERST